MNPFSLALILSLAPQMTASAVNHHFDAAKARYEAAAYDEALASLKLAAELPSARRTEVELYRALCFIALGSLPDAERSVGALVAADPSFVPPPGMASPKALTIVTDFRRKEMPAVARRLLDNGRKAYKEEQFSQARENFGLLLTVLDDPLMKGWAEGDDLRTLAEGFVALADAKRAAAAAAAVSAPPRPAPPPPPAPVSFQPAAAVRETLPPWTPPSAIVGQTEYTGSLRVLIGEDGRVKSAAIVQPSHASYDVRLLEAARTWLYTPALRNGRPVEFEKVISVRLRPQPR
jgi:hypothetical protein